MTAAEVLQIIGTIISAGTLAVSVLVFINTVRKTQLDKRQNLATEKFYSFLKSIEAFFELVNPQDSYDRFTTVYYSDGTYNYENKYAEVKRLESSILYQLEEVKLYAPDEFTDSTAIIDKLSQIKTDISKINSLLCKDISNRFRGNAYQHMVSVQQLLDAYLDNYNLYVHGVFDTLHTIRNSIVYSHKQ